MAFKFSNMGTRIREIREPILVNGHVEVVVTGHDDLQDFIDSFRDSCDVELIVKRCAVEPELLNKRFGSYGDFTQFPKTYAEALQKMIDASNLFDSLSQDKRNLFDNDVFKFISSMDDPDWLKKAGFIAEESESEVKSE